MTQVHIKKGYTYILFSLLSTTVFSLTAEYLFLQNPTVNPANLLFWSISGAVILSSPFFLGTNVLRTNIRKLPAKDFQKIVLIGFVSFVGATLWNFALKASSAGVLTLL